MPREPNKTGIRRYTSSRSAKGFKPLHYFKGTRKQLNALTEHQIALALNRAGVELPKGEKINTAKKLKKDVLEQVRELERQSKTCINIRALSITTKRGRIWIQITRREDGRYLITQTPVIHGVSENREWGMSAFQALEGILATGLSGEKSPNAYTPKYVREPKRTVRGEHGQTYADNRARKITNGDGYTLELMDPVEGSKSGVTGFVRDGKATRILRVNIRLRRMGKKATAEKKKFYHERLRGTPIRFTTVHRPKTNT